MRIAPLWAEECLSCHRERDPTLSAAWEKGAHRAVGVTCTTCHGHSHDGSMASRARPTATCITGCHQAQGSSHALSKHGVIGTLEADRSDFSLPLKEGNQRAPSCAYCHLHANEHDESAGIAPLHPLIPPLTTLPEEAARAEARATPCRDCHSPRFVDTWFESGDRMVEIGRMKVREAEAVVARFENPEARAILERMKSVHLRNIRLGVGHASPDDQWWHGQAALDGDLLRIKSFASFNSGP
ncbi:MAG: hypothetical protein H7834_08100 [Magnetococcus sp. YQC-9]